MCQCCMKMCKCEPQNFEMVEMSLMKDSLPHVVYRCKTCGHEFCKEAISMEMCSSVNGVSDTTGI